MRVGGQRSAAHMAAPSRPSLAEVRAAERRLGQRLHRTPLLTSAGLDRLAGRRLLFKCELFQRTGSFKVRGERRHSMASGRRLLLTRWKQRWLLPPCMGAEVFPRAQGRQQGRADLD